VGTDTATVEQNGTTRTVEALSTGEAIETFYDYYDAEAHTTKDFSIRDTTIVFLWEGPKGLSLVVINDRRDDPDGGAVRMQFEGLPEEASWAVRDDDPGNDQYTTGPDVWTADWQWNGAHTDGAAIRGGLDGAFEVTVSAEFQDGIDELVFLTGDAGSPDRVGLSTTDPFTIRSGIGASFEPPTDVTVGDSVRLNGSPSTGGRTSISLYQWDVDGDGAYERTGERIDHVFDRPGTYPVTLKVVGENGKTDTTTRTVGVSPPASVAIGEAGRIETTTEWRRVSLNGTYEDPVVVTGPPSAGGDPVHTRVRNVTADGFELRLEEWNYTDGTHAAESVGYLVVEAGRHRIGNNHSLVAGSTATNQTFTRVGYDDLGGPAVVSTTVVGRNGSAPVVTRHRDVGSTGFDVRLQGVEAAAKAGVERPAERVDYVAFEAGSATTYATRIHADTADFPATTGFYSSGAPTVSVRFPTSVDDPAVLGSIQTFAGADTASVRTTSRSATGAGFKLEEDTSVDSEVVHNAETLGYVVIGAPGLVFDGGAGDGGGDRFRAAINRSVETPADGQQVVFDAVNSTRQSAGVDRYEWRFGDGTTATGERVFHTFEEPGRYPVTLTVVAGGQRELTTTLVDVTDTGNRSDGGTGDDGAVRVTGVTPSKPGTIVEDVVLRNTYSANVTTVGDATVRNVTFEVDGRTYVDRDGSDGWSRSIDVSVLDGDTALTVTAHAADGQSDSYTAGIDVVGVPGWVVQLNRTGQVSYDDGELRLQKTVPKPPVDVSVTVPGVPVVGGEQSFKTRASFGVVYDMPDGTATLMGSGLLEAQVLGRPGSGEIGARGRLAVRGDTWRFQRGTVYAEVSITAWRTNLRIPGVPYSPAADLSVSPNARLAADIAPEDGSVAVTGGTITPGVTATGEVSVDAGVASATGTVTGDVSGSVDVPEPYDPRARAELRGSVTVATFGLDRGYTVGPYVQRIGYDDSTAAVPVTAVAADGWSVAPHRGTAPLGADGTVRAADATGPAEALAVRPGDRIDRLTDDRLADRSPAVTAVNGSGGLAVWSRQPADKPVLAGRDVYWSRTDAADDGWSTPRPIVDTNLTELDPVVAHDPAADRTVAAWTVLDRRVQANATPSELAPDLEIAYAIRENGSWSAPRRLTNDSTIDLNPRLAVEAGRVAVAWERDRDGELTTAADRRVRAATIDANGTVTTVTTTANASRPALSADGNATTPFGLAYLETGPNATADATVANGSVVVASLDATGLTERTRVAATGVRALAAGGGTVGWAAEGGTRLRTATVEGGGVETIGRPAGPVDALDVAVAGTTTVVGYRAATPTGPRNFYTARAEGAWRTHRPLVGRAPTGETVWQPSLAGTDTGVRAAYAVRNLSANGTGDVIAVNHPLQPDLVAAVEVDVTNRTVAVGESINLTWTVENRGEATAAPTTVAITDGNGTRLTPNASLPALAPGGSATGTVTVSLPTTGRVGVVADPGDRLADLNESDDRAVRVVRQPNPAAASVSVESSGDRFVVTGTVANEAPVRAGTVGYRLTANGTPLESGTVELAPGARRTVSTVVNASALTRGAPVTLAVTPARAQTDVTDDTASVRPFQVDLAVSGPAVQFSPAVGSGGLVASVPVATRSETPTNATLEIRSEGRLVASRNVSLPAPTGTAAFETVDVSIPAGELAENDTATIIVVTDYDATPQDNADRTTVSVRSVRGPGGLFPDGVPGGTSDRVPVDVDGDGRLEDLNGNGRFEFVDVIELIFALQSGELSSSRLTADQVAALDHSGDGRVSFPDVIDLLFQL
jgi:PKD repeat protein